MWKTVAVGMQSPKYIHTTDVKNNYSIKTLEVLGFFFFLFF